MSNRISELVDQFKALGDAQRLRVLALCRAGELSVSELVEVLGQSQPRVSQHLKLLCDAGLLDRSRDGKRVFYRLAASPSTLQRRLVALISSDSALFDADLERLRALRRTDLPTAEASGAEEQEIARALIELTLARSLGDLLDIGCGRGRVLKLLASRAKRAVGVDINSEARSIARIQLFLAGAENCSLRQGDMYQLAFDDSSFDTVVLDDVLGTAAKPAQALDEARRVLRPTGRLLVLEKLNGKPVSVAAGELASMSGDRGMRMARPIELPARKPEWLLSVITPAEHGNPIQSGAIAAA